MLKRSDIRVRDPYIVYEDGVYYLYATTGDKTLSYYFSSDLENWEYGGVAFEIPDNFWAYKDVWAAEVHRYKGKFYLFVSLLGKNGLRGTQIAVSDKPDERFVPLVNHPATPLDKSCIDGTLFVNEGKPYIFYSRDWPDNFVEEKGAYVGEIYCAELTEDLCEIKGEPVRLFTSDESPLSKNAPHNIVWEGREATRFGSDAPFVQRLSDGSLYMSWSPYPKDHYVVFGVVSKSGNVYGPWEHLLTPLFEDNGGHAMFFEDSRGRNIMSLHAPECEMFERAHLYHVAEKDGILEIVEELPF